MRNGFATLPLGPVALNVAGLQAARDFYERAIGLEPFESLPGRELLGSGGLPVVELRASPDAPARPPGTTGLFHLAVLQPDRAALGTSLRRLLDAGVPLDGASDHLVSEALYVRDPEGNGIEIYRDRPPGGWDWSGGEVAMATLPLDLSGLLAGPEVPGPPGPARLGHVHLNVSDLAAATGFYTGVLGLDLTSASYPGAAFVSAGGYHHHFGLNTWNGAGAAQPPAGARGLAGVTLTVPAAEELEAIAGRAEAAAVPAQREGDLLVLRDPDGVELRVKAAG